MARLTLQHLTWIVALVSVAVVALIGTIAYSSLSRAVGAVEQAAELNPMLPQWYGILAEAQEAEAGVKAFKITSDSTTLQPYFRFRESWPERRLSLAEAGAPEGFRTLGARLDTLVTDQLKVMEAVLMLRQETILKEEIVNIRETIASKSAGDGRTQPATEKDGKGGKQSRDQGLRRLFAKSGDKSQRADAKSSEELLRQIDWQLKTLNVQQETEQQRMQSEELRISRADSLVSMGLLAWQADMRKQEQMQVLQKAQELEAASSGANEMILVFTLVASVLMLGVPLMVIVYARKNNAHKRLLRDARERAEQQAKERERFVASLSHEIRTPLHAVSGFTDQLLKEPLAPAHREQLEIIKSASIHLIEMLNSVLDYARMESGKVTLEHRPFDPAKEAAEVFRIMGSKARQRGLDFTLEIGEGLSGHVQGDALRYRQILFNLLSNALKFTEDGNVHLSLSAEVISSHQVQLKMEVTDTGVGIPKDRIHSVFEPYEQASDSIQRVYGGTGLGLPITKLLVDLHGGSIALDTERTQGCRFTVLLPLEVSPDTETQNTSAEVKPESDVLRGIRVLIVDDEPFNRRLLSGMLSQWGCLLEEAVDGESALRRIEQGGLHLLLLDLKLPGKSGIEVAAAVRGNAAPAIAGLPILGLTASASRDRDACLQAGMDEVLAKPFVEKELLASIHHLLHRRGWQRRVKIDLSPLRKMAGGNEAFVTEMVGIFIRTLRQGKADLNAALAQDDPEIAAEVAHRLLPSVASMGCRELQSILEKLEKADARQPGDTWKMSIQKGNDEAEEILSELASFEKGQSALIHSPPR